MLANRKTIIVKLLIIVLSTICVLSYDVDKAEALDIGRYYQQARDNAEIYNNVFVFIHDQILTNVDFIYQTALYLALRIGIPLSLVTIFFLSIFYIAVLRFIDLYYKVSNYKYIYLVFILTLCPIIWVVSISRTTAALSFFILGCAYVKKNHLIKSCVFFLAAIFTHVSMMIYIALVLIAYVISKLRINKARSLILAVIAVVGYLVPTMIMDVISPYIALMQSRYAYYAEMEMQSPLFASSLGIGDKIPILFIYIFLFYLLVKDSREDWTYWMLYVCWGLLAFFIWSDVMMTNRIIMLSVPFVGISFYHLLNSKGYKNKLQLVSCLGVLIALGSLYTYRAVF